MTGISDEAALDILFRAARTHSKFKPSGPRLEFDEACRVE
jgi:hypothetical protein